MIDLLNGLDRLFLLEKSFKLDKTKLNNALFDLNQNLSDKRIQNIVQNFRRDIHNNRYPKKTILDEISNLDLTSESTDLLLEFFEAFDKLQSIKADLRQIYSSQTLLCRIQLQEIAKEESLRKGLILSSQSFLNGLNGYIEKEVSLFKKKELQSEFTLLKYLTRMCAKTSPFSTFNNLVFATFTDNENVVGIKSVQDDSKIIKSHIRLNNYIFKYLKGLLGSLQDVTLALQLRANPTIIIKDSHFEYLTNHNNIEAFQRLPLNGILTFILNEANKRKSGISFESIIQRINKHIDSSETDVYNYVKQLIDWGFLEIDWGVSGTDPDWDKLLIKRFKKIFKQQNSKINLVTDCLGELRRITEKYAVQNSFDRVDTLQNAYKLLRDTCMTIHELAGLPEIERKTREELTAEMKEKKLLQQEESGEQTVNQESAQTDISVFEHKNSSYFSFKPESVIYEDTSRNVQIILQREKSEKLIGQLAALLNNLYLFDNYWEEKNSIKNYFLSTYSEEGTVNLLTFYKDYYRDVKLSSKKADTIAKSSDDTEEATANDLTTDASDSNKEEIVGKSKWTEIAASVFKKNSQINSTRIDIQLSDLLEISEAMGGKKEPIPTKPNSQAAFMQVFEDKNKNGEVELKGVINGIVPGYGKMISRFLHIFPVKVTNSIRKWNEELMDDDSLFIENCDASYFNANLHPALMPYEIRIPGGHNNVSVERQLSVKDFNIVYDKENNEIILIHAPSQKRAYLFDLGFQGTGRSKLFQLLKVFSLGDNISTAGLNSVINSIVRNVDRDAGLQEKSIVISPRIVYENQL
ncbi:MAG TPA: lantibiotic dehydratase, partial [Chitinophagaceae bacterium]|nr:lantibiotic dehydratase [Chitinophagaceae bacterium]